MLSKRLRIWIVGVLFLASVIYLFRQDLIFKPYHYYRSLSANIEKITLEIPIDDFLYIDSLRNDVLKTQIVKSSHKSFVKAVLTIDDKILDVKIRLKGDQLDHYQTNPPSYRVRTLKNKTVLGTNKFSLQYFGARNFMPEWIFHKILEQHDILSLHTDVVELNVNQNKTVCTFEEHFTHHLTDRFNRPRGPIICISEDVLWNNGVLNDSVKYETPKEIYFNSPIKEFNYYAVLDSNVRASAKALLNDFRNNKREISEVFDIERLAIHMAISELTNTHHGLNWHNRRFYYNPSSRRLEPIGFDGSSWHTKSDFAYDTPSLNYLKWSGLYVNKQFVDAYLGHLERISKESYLDDFFRQNSNEIYELENRIYKKNLFHSSDYQYIYRNAQWIRENINDYKSRLLISLKG